MRRLTKKERVIMDHFWKQGPMFVRDLLNLYPEPHPTFNTLASQVRTLEKDGFLRRELFGNSYRYAPLLSEQEYGRRTLSGTVEGASDPQTFIPRLVQFYREGRFPVDKLAVYYPFEDFQQAFADSRSGKAIKPILVF